MANRQYGGRPTCVSEATKGDRPMADTASHEPNTRDTFIRLDDGDMHIVEDGKPGASTLLLIHASAASLATWDLVVPSLASAFRVIRVDLLGCGKSTTPAGGY